MAIRPVFGIDEWYHCYTRGVDGRKTFETEKDYARFLQLLYLTNDKKKRHRSDLVSPTLEKVLQLDRKATIVDIGAYCLMPNHFHLLIKEKAEGSISAFMQRLGTAYTMYFNIRHHRVGSLFVKPFRSKHLADDRYFQRALQYIHCNPAELFEPGWKNGQVKNLKTLEEQLLRYPYSSFADHTDKKRMTRSILDDSVFSIADQLSPAEMLSESALYYQDISMSRRRLAGG